MVHIYMYIYMDNGTYNFCTSCITCAQVLFNATAKILAKFFGYFLDWKDIDIFPWYIDIFLKEIWYIPMIYIYWYIPMIYWSIFFSHVPFSYGLGRWWIEQNAMWLCSSISNRVLFVVWTGPAWPGQDASVTFWSRFSEAYFSISVGDARWVFALNVEKYFSPAFHFSWHRMVEYRTNCNVTSVWVQCQVVYYGSISGSRIKSPRPKSPRKINKM